MLLVYKVISGFALKAMHIGIRVKQWNSTNMLVHLCYFLTEQQWPTANYQQYLHFKTQLAWLYFYYSTWLPHYYPLPRTKSSNLRSWCLCLSYGYIRLYFKTIIREKHGGTCLYTQISEAEPRGWIFVSLRSAWSTQEISEQPDLLHRENLIWCWVVVLCIIHIYINTLHIKASDTSLSNYRISFLGFTSYINSWSLERGTKIWRLFLTIGVYNPQVNFPLHGLLNSSLLFVIIHSLSAKWL